MDFSSIKNQRVFINTVVDKKLLMPSILIGIIGNYFLYLSSFLARLINNSTIDNEYVQVFIKDPIISILSFSLSCLLTFGLCWLLKGRANIRDYVTAQGFSGIYIFIITIALFSILLVNKIPKENGQIPIQYIVLMLTSVLILIITIFYAIKYAIVAVSEIFKFKIIKSLTIYGLINLPLFVILNEFSKIK